MKAIIARILMSLIALFAICVAILVGNNLQIKDEEKEREAQRKNFDTCVLDACTNESEDV